MPWNFVDSGNCPGRYNMQTDEEMAERLLENSAPPALRLYGWSPWAISLGHHQDERDIDREKCETDGVEIVRRPTGGRAILHAQELTYCIVLDGDGRSVLDAYNQISSALVEGLKLYGIRAGVERSQPEFTRLYRQSSSIPCFSSTARYEVLVGGKKLVGSAQRRYRSGGREVILQHGSILCGTAHERLADYIVPGDENLREIVRRRLHESTCSIEEVTGRETDRSRLADCIREGFARIFGVIFETNTVGETGTFHG